MPSPGRAPLRRKALPGAAWPITVAVNEMGPGVLVVSPPSSLMPNKVWSIAKPAAKAANQADGVATGTDTVRRYPSGVAPIAARSDKFTRSSFRPTV
jgi:acyl-coenzyme A synthetase/AMP-(fatty) acid ligase